MKQIPAIKAVMTPFPHCVESDQPISAAGEMMRELDFRHLPVVEKGKLVGAITDRDVQLATELAADPAAGGELLVRDVLRGHDPPYAVELVEPLDIVVLHMAQHGIDSALVVKNERLVGIFTMTDACRSLGSLLRSLFPRGSGDDAA